ncbi:MAG: hypothetical protein ACW967_05230 [Candidatus Hodarchaeales archaeon]|jgi:hypothetical protein
MIYTSFKKILLILFPFFVLIVGDYFFDNLFELPNWIIDNDLGSRKFILGICGFAALTIMINLVHLKIFTEERKLKITYQLSHRFSADRDIHELKVGNNYICTGCFGSFLGLLLGLIILILYLVINIQKGSFYGPLLLGTGSAFILIGYLRYFIEFNPKIRIVQHFALFIGIFFVLLSIDIIYQSFYMLLISIPIILSFIGSRLFLAKLNDEGNNKKVEKVN